MNAKEIKAALADEGVQTAIAKEVCKAVKIETKRILDIVKAVEVPEERETKAAVKAAVKSVVEGIKVA